MLFLERQLYHYQTIMNSHHHNRGRLRKILQRTYFVQKKISRKTLLLASIELRLTVELPAVLTLPVEILRGIVSEQLKMKYLATITSPSRHVRQG